MGQRMTDAHLEEVQSTMNAKAEIANLKRSFQAEIKNLKEDADC